MGIGGVNKNNFTWQNKLPQIADINKQYARQTEQAHSPADKKAENPIKDVVEVSMDGKQRAREATNALSEMENSYLEMMKQQLETAREQGKAMAESTKVRTKCLLIAMRIMSGDKVPSEDYRYLAKNDLELYSKAVSMRREKENPQKHKRLSEDEKSGGNEKGGDAARAESIQSASGEIKAEVSGDSAEGPEGQRE